MQYHGLTEATLRPWCEVARQLASREAADGLGIEDEEDLVETWV